MGIIILIFCQNYKHMGCGGSKDKKKPNLAKRTPPLGDGAVTGGIEPGKVPKHLENLKSLKNLNEDKPVMESTASNRKAKTNNLKASMKDFDDSDDEDKVKKMSKTVG